MQPKYSHTLAVRMGEYIQNGDYEGLTVFLEQLTNSAFRTACIMLGGELPDKLDRDAFWQLATHLMLWHPKAFVVTMGKAVVRRVKAGKLAFDDAAAETLYQQMEGPQHIIDRDKLLREWLPACTDPGTMELLLSRLETSTVQRQVDFLLYTVSLPAAYVLLRTLRMEEHDRQLLLSTARQLMRRGDSLAFNTASLLRTYFDLNELRGTFSLNIPPYALSRLDTDYEAFCRTVS